MRALTSGVARCEGVKDSAARRVVVRDLQNTPSRTKVSDELGEGRKEERAVELKDGDSPVVTSDDDSASSSLLSIEDLVGGLDSLLQERGRKEKEKRESCQRTRSFETKRSSKLRKETGLTFSLAALRDSARSSFPTAPM